MKYSNLLKIQNEILLNKGISYNLVTGEINPSDGYMVSLPGYTVVVNVDFLESMLVQYLNEHAFLLANSNRWLGVWFNGTNYVFDVSELIEDRETAIETGILRDQKAIWDNRQKDEISLPEPQRCGTETQKRDYARETAKRL